MHSVYTVRHAMAFGEIFFWLHVKAPAKKMGGFQKL